MFPVTEPGAKEEGDDSELIECSRTGSAERKGGNEQWLLGEKHHEGTDPRILATATSKGQRNSHLQGPTKEEFLGGVGEGGH